MNPNLVTLRIVLLAVTVAIAANCMGAVHKSGAIRTMLMAEAPALLGSTWGGLERSQEQEKNVLRR
jgi:hypothetical protein